MRIELKKARKSKSLFQRDIAKYLEMTLTSYQRIELGTRGTSEDNWIKIFEFFGEEIPLHKLMENV